MTDSTNQGKCRIFGVIFFISLALNVFAAGYFLSHRGALQWGQRGGMFFSRQLDQLSEPAKEKTKHIVEAYRPKFKAQMQEVRKAREAIHAEMRKADYSRARAAARFDRMQVEVKKMQKLAQSMMLDVADRLTPEERSQLFKPSKRDGKRDWDKWGNTEEKSALPQQKNALLAE